MAFHRALVALALASLCEWRQLAATDEQLCEDPDDPLAFLQVGPARSARSGTPRCREGDPCESDANMEQLRSDMSKVLDFGAAPGEDAFSGYGGAHLAPLGRPEMDVRTHSRSKLVAQFKSYLEERQREIRGHRGLPPGSGQTVKMISLALQEVERIQDGKAIDVDTNPHATDLGYPLTVLEALIFAANLTDIFSRPKYGDTPNGKNFIEFATIIVTYGYDSPRARDFYARAIQYMSYMPYDAGWLNQWIATGLTYTINLGLHAYRKVPWKWWGFGYDESFSVRALPEPPEGKPLVIGLVSDWACGTPASDAVLRELKKHNPDVVIHLGDVYYSGTRAEQREFWLDPMVAAFGKERLILNIPGNHDYYSAGGKGFFEAIDELRQQNASYFVLRGKHWQILALDTGLLGSVNTVSRNTMTFLTQDQHSWALQQLEIGKKQGLKTIMLSHHQLFSRTEPHGFANSLANEAAFIPDQMRGTYPWLWAFLTRSWALPGHLPRNAEPAVNTRLLSQFPTEMLKESGVAAWYWGHEHNSMLFKPYAGLERGRLIGNGCIPNPKNIDYYATTNKIDAEPWGGFAETLPGSRVGTGDNFWNLGFVTVTLDGPKATARYFQMADKDGPKGPQWGSATKYWEEEF